MQSLHRLGYREVGLAGTGRADTKDHRIIVDGLHVFGLAHRLWADGLATALDDVRRQRRRNRLRRLYRHHVHRVLDRIGGYGVATAGDGFELVKDLRGAGHLIIGTGDSNDIAAGKKVRIQAVIEHAQVIVRATQHDADVGGI